MTDASAVQELTGNIEAQDKTYAIAVPPTANGERILLAVTEEQLPSVATLSANRITNWKEATGADFVMITDSKFATAIAPLREQRQREGYRVGVVAVDDIYDEFNFGNKSPQAIKDFLSFAAKNWKIAPRFVLFVGDASYDGRNYLGAGDFDFVPTKLLDSEYLETASDDWFADFDNDGLAEISVRRLPVRTVAETTNLVTKLLHYEQTKTPTSALLVADANDGFNFEQASSALRNLLPADGRIEELRRGQLDAAQAKAQLLAALARGQRFINYLGHGSINLWRGNLLTANEAAMLTNEVLPVFVMMNCLNGYFHDPTIESLSKALVKAESGGAIAVWASSGLTLPQDQQAMNREFYRQLLNKDSRGAKVTLGEAVRRAKAVSPQSDIRRTWILLGDPTLRLP